MLLDFLKFLLKYPFASAAKDVRAIKCVVLSKDIAVVAGKDGLFLINRNDIYIGKSVCIRTPARLFRAARVLTTPHKATLVVCLCNDRGRGDKKKSKSGAWMTYFPTRPCISSRSTWKAWSER